MGSASKFYNQRIVYLDSVVAVVEEQYHHEPIEHESYSDVVLRMRSMLILYAMPSHTVSDNSNSSKHSL